ncbi:hypothetical protein [Photobacterium indicum]|uniref:hypothetical protein n=1 Tax=Photobacterium indicum TaxID=81447 RepID=UPI003D0FEE5E
MRILVLLFTCFAILSCSSTPRPAINYSATQQSCVHKLIQFKQTVKTQGVQDAQLFWTPDYPSLAFDRFSVALIPQLTSAQSKTQWLNHVAQQAEIQRGIEYNNLLNKQAINIESQERCAKQLTTTLATNDQFWSQLQQYPPIITSNYQNWQRIIGIYPVSRLFAIPSIYTEKKRILSGFIEAVDNDTIAYAMSDKPRLTQQEIQSWFAQTTARADLHWPLLTEDQLTQLLAFYAPEFIVESASLDDKPGLVTYVSDDQAAVNTNEPIVYIDHSFTLFHGRTLLQLNYSLWFANRTAKSSFDPYAGKFDGVLFRLTLDEQGKPYILDSIHHCGCYHMVFALNEELQFAPTNAKIESPTSLHIYRQRSADTLKISLSSGEHMIKDVHWADKDVFARRLTPLNYQTLRSLPTPNGQNKSLFDQNGMLLISERLERFYLWPFGVASPGTTRQIGQHAVTFIGERHFDDANIFDTLFLNP